VGPVSLEQFVDFLPEGRTMARFIEFTRFLVGRASAFDVQIVLRAAEVPYCRLSDDGFDAPRLGLLGWLKTEEFQADAGDAEFTWVN
jgi:type VI secretion system protein ImpH